MQQLKDYKKMRGVGAIKATKNTGNTSMSRIKITWKNGKKNKYMDISNDK